MKVTVYWLQLKDGKRAYLNYRIDGKRYREKTDIVIHKNDKLAKEKKIALERLRGKIVERFYEGTLTVKSDVKIVDYYETFIQSSNLKSIRKYISTQSHTKDYFPDMTIKKITSNDLQGFADYLYSKFSIQTVNSYIKTLIKLLNMAVKDGIIHKRPEVNLKSFKGGLVKQILTLDEIKILRGKECPVPELKKAFIFACYTGVGYAEIKKLTHENIRNGILTYERAKNGNVVHVKLKDWLEYNKKGRLFKLSSQSSTDRVLKRWVKKSGINKDVSFYCGRHSFAVNLLISGVDIRRVSSLLGHSSLKSTMIYLEYVDTLKGDAIDMLD